MGFRKKKNQRGHKVKGTFKVMQKFEIESKSKRGDKQSIQKREKWWSNTKREVFISECMHSSTVFPSKAVWHSYYSKVVIVSNHNKNTHTTVLMKKKKKNQTRKEKSLNRSYLLLAPAAFSKIQTQIVGSTQFYSSKCNRIRSLVFMTKKKINNNSFGFLLTTLMQQHFVVVCSKT